MLSGGNYRDNDVLAEQAWLVCDAQEKTRRAVGNNATGRQKIVCSCASERTIFFLMLGENVASLRSP